jgi:hypothetical protein
MIYRAALVKQRGIAVGVMSVEPRTVRSTSEAVKGQIAFAPVFPGLPIVLMAQDMAGDLTYYGCKDLVAILRKVPLDAIRWREYSHGMQAKVIAGVSRCT